MPKNISKHLLIATLIFLFSLIAYFTLEDYSRQFDEKLRDTMFLLRGTINHTDKVVIVDIDEKTLKAMGQWPFNRKKTAQVLANLTSAGAGIIGLDIVFSEPDRSSPKAMAKVLGVDGEFRDYDKLLGSVIASSPVVAGYFFLTESENRDTAPQIPANFTETIKTSDDWIVRANGVVTNIPYIQNSAYSSGFFNALSGNSGRISKMPLLIRYKDKIYPSLALEMLRIASTTESVDIHTSENGVRGIELKTGFIPTDKAGFLSLNWRGPKKHFPYISYVDVYNGNFDAKDVSGKFVLLGTSATGLVDLRATVYDAALPGVEIHANIIDSILAGDLIHSPTFFVGADTMMIFLLTVVLMVFLYFIPAVWTIVSVVIISSALYAFYYWLLFSEGLVLNLIYPFATLILSTVASISLHYMSEERQKKFIRDKFSRKVSSAVVDDLLLSTDHSFSGKKKEVSIYFSDIRGFTGISEKVKDPEDLINLLNLYMEPMVEKIVDLNGTVDKFIGDAIMAYWNAPQDVENHADAAVTCALEQIELLNNLNKKILDEYGVEIKIGIGINTGVVTVGEMGSSGRSDYTIIGDSVNLTSRIEGLSKFYSVAIVITEYTKNALKEQYVIRELDLTQVKGKSEAVRLFEVLSIGVPSDEFKVENKKYMFALEQYRAARFEEALKIFEELYRANSLILYNRYIQRSKKYIESPPEKFDGVFYDKRK